jgi:hypothetical protein
MFRSKLTILSAVLMVSAFLAAGCATDAPGSGAGDSCVVDSDCSGERVCSDDGVCTDSAEAVCTEDADCDEIPDAHCSDDQLITYSGVCEGDEEKACNYVADSETCTAGCSQGACNADPCDGKICDDPPDAYCEDADTLVTYEQSGTCSDGDCSYSTSSDTCVHGCSNGACNPGACADEVCDTPPDPECDGNTGLVYADSGTCYEDDGAATCSYDITFNNCDYTAATCQSDTGTCDGGLTQVGGAVIVEYMVEPVGTFHAAGQWFEVVNTSGAGIDLDGWKIRAGTSDTDFDEYVFDDATEAVPSFPDGARLLFSRGSDPAGDGSITPDHKYSGVGLPLVSGWLELINSSDEVVDRVFWEAGTIMAGHSRKLDPDANSSAEANDDFANWCPEMDESYGNLGNLGSPAGANPICDADPCDGYTCEMPADYCNADGNAVEFTEPDPVCQESRLNNPYCDFGPVEVECADTEYCLAGVCEPVGDLPEPGEVIFTEFMGNPSLNDRDAEYLELYNTTDRELALFSLTIEDNETGSMHNSFVIEDTDATIEANSYAVFVTSTDSSENGGIADAYELADSPLKDSPPSEGLVISLVRADGTLIDEAHYGEPASGASQQLSLDAYTGGAADPAASNDGSDNFCEATAASSGYTSGDLGSPGEDNEVCGN